MSRTSISSSGGHVLPATKTVPPAAKSSTAGNLRAPSAIRPTRSNRVSPATVTFVTPIPASSACESASCTNNRRKERSARRKAPPHGRKNMESGRNISRYLPTGELRKVVQPKLVLDEDSHLRFHRVEKTGRIARCIGRQVENPVSPGVVPAYLVSGGREESEEYLIRGIILPDGLHYGPALFELAERRSVEPNYPFATAHGLLQLTENVPASLIPQRGFPHERGDHLHGTGIDTDTQIIPPHLQASLIVSYTAAGMPARPHGAKV